LQSSHPALQARTEQFPASHFVMAWGKEQVQPHTFASPAPPQVSGGVHWPQSTSPQPVSNIPHEAPSCAQLFAMHPR